MTDRQMIKAIKKNIYEVDPTAEVYLYGSRAKGKARLDSDWDILILTDGEQLGFQGEERFMDHICDLIVSTGQVIHLFAYARTEWHTKHAITPFYQAIQREAIPL